MKIKSLAAALLVPMLFACNSQADRQALKEELPQFGIRNSS